MVFLEGKKPTEIKICIFFLFAPFSLPVCRRANLLTGDGEGAGVEQRVLTPPPFLELQRRKIEII
jgi:hypothetical protein